MEDKIILEVGVSDGFDTEKLIKKYSLPLYGFEPVPYLFDILDEKFKNNKNVHIHQAAVDIEDGVKDFYISNPGVEVAGERKPQGKLSDGTTVPIHPYGCSSLHKFSDDIHEKWPNRPDFNSIETTQVKTINLEKFFDERNFTGEIVYMHCDAQGNDVNVLKSLGKYMNNIKEGVIEVAFVTELYENTNNTIEEAVAFFKGLNFDISYPKNKANARSHEANFKFKRRD